MKKLGVVVGSIRERSWSKKVAQIMASQFPEGWEAEFITIADVPFYNQDWDDADFDSEIPAPVTRVREQIQAVDALLFVTPEYNRGVPGVLKNFIDVISRPAGTFMAAGKPALVASVSIGGISGFAANHSLRQNLMFLDVPVMAQPEIYLGGAHQLFGSDDMIGSEADLETDKKNLNPSTLEMLQGAIDKFVDFSTPWIQN